MTKGGGGYEKGGFLNMVHRDTCDDLCHVLFHYALLVSKIHKHQENCVTSDSNQAHALLLKSAVHMLWVLCDAFQMSVDG